MPRFLDQNPQWIREPITKTLTEDTVEIITQPGTDLWQRTYYGFRHDNAPILQVMTEDLYFSFTVKTCFESKQRFDQCGIAIYLDSENWLKASAEYENNRIQRLGSVVTNQGYSDWSTTDISSEIRTIWYRLSRRRSDYRIEYSTDGKLYQQMRICHLHSGEGRICFGIYACSPEDSSFHATFSNMEITACRWPVHQ